MRDDVLADGAAHNVKVGSRRADEYWAFKPRRAQHNVELGRQFDDRGLGWRRYHPKWHVSVP